LTVSLCPCFFFWDAEPINICFLLQLLFFCNIALLPRRLLLLHNLTLISFQPFLFIPLCDDLFPSPRSKIVVKLLIAISFIRLGLKIHSSLCMIHPLNQILRILSHLLIVRLRNFYEKRRDYRPEHPFFHLRAMIVEEFNLIDFHHIFLENQVFLYGFPLLLLYSSHLTIYWGLL
jgi:hypothetical protein